MKQFRLIIAIVLLMVSLVLLFDMLFTPQPIQIILETGEEVASESAGYFSLTEVLLLLVCSFLIGSTTMYLFYQEETGQLLKKMDRRREHDHILPFLKDAEKTVFVALKGSQSGMLQNQLVLSLGLSKVKVTRIISKLEQKDLVVKERHGLTNRIKLK